MGIPFAAGGSTFCVRCMKFHELAHLAFGFPFEPVDERLVIEPFSFEFIAHEGTVHLATIIPAIHQLDDVERDSRSPLRAAQYFTRIFRIRRPLQQRTSRRIQRAITFQFLTHGRCQLRPRMGFFR